MKNKRFLLLSFLIPLIIYLFFFYINGLLTDRMILIGDSYEQYYPLFHYLKGILEGTNSIFYSFSKSIGGSMFGTFFYYISSPINLLVYFIKDQYILDFMTYLTIFKLSLCGLTMYIYMSKKFKTSSYILLIFSILYSVSGYNLNYFLNIMWLDVIVLAPIVLLGIDKIIENKSPLLYIITLTICIYSNYYISYMVCIFCVLYFTYEILLKYNFKENKKEIINSFKKFIIPSLLSGLMCSFFLIPCILEMLDYGRSVNINGIFTFDYNIFNLIANTYISSFDTIHPFNTYSINLYCGIIILPLIYLYFSNKNILKREKILSLTLILIMIIPCFIGPLNYIWHLFTIPIGYNYRYSFLLIIFLLRLGYKSFTNIYITKVKILEYLSIYISYSIIIMFISYFNNYYPHLSYIQIWISNAFTIIYLLLLYKLKDNKKLNKIFFILILIECIINVGIVLNNDEFYKRDELEYKYEYLNNYSTDKRITIMDYGANSSLITNKLGINYFLSTHNKSKFDMYKIAHNFEINMTNEFYLQNNYPYIFNSLFSNEIIISSTEIPNYIILDEIYINGEKLIVNKNPNALNLAFTVKNNCNNLDFKVPYDEKVLNCLLGEENSFYKEITYTKNNNQITYNANYDYFIYLPEINKNIENLKNTFGENLLFIGDNIVFIKNKNINNIINLQLDSELLDQLKIYYFDYDLFNEKIQNLKNTTFTYTINKNKLTGNISTEKGLLMLSIPYEDGIEIYLNGNIVSTENVLNSFIGINVQEGNYTIEIIYNNSNNIGIIISLAATTITILYIKKKKNNISN